MEWGEIFGVVCMHVVCCDYGEYMVMLRINWGWTKEGEELDWEVGMMRNCGGEL